MKKYRLAAIMVLCAVLLSACGQSPSLSTLLPGGVLDDLLPPSLTAMEQLEQAVEQRADKVKLKRSDWDYVDGAWSDVTLIIEDYLNETPELYWVDWRSTQLFYYGEAYDKSAIEVRLAYFDELDPAACQTRIDEVADRFLAAVPEGANDWETALSLHDSLIRHVTYTDTEYDQTLYGALAEGKAVCNGFAMAYQYLLRRAGIPCDTVIGYTSALNADTAQTDPGAVSRHAWNIATFADENGTYKSCYIDTTWDNTDDYDLNGDEYVGTKWFCLSQAQMDAVGRCGVEDIYFLSLWDLDSEHLNYYAVTDSLITGDDSKKYSRQQIIDALSAQQKLGRTVLSVRWEDEARFLRDSKKLKNGELSKVLKKLGLKKVGYTLTDADETDGNFCLDIYINWNSKTK